ncbi:MAG: HEPN domain-containing protein [Bacteroidota bacterium]
MQETQNNSADNSNLVYGTSDLAESTHFKTQGNRPYHTQKDLNYLLEKLITKYLPLKIFCFHKSITTKTDIGCFRNTSTFCGSDYWLFMVTENSARIEHAVQDFANAHYNQGTITILVHGQEAIANAASNGNRFFSSVYDTGQLLYSMDGWLSNTPVRPQPSTQNEVEAEERYKLSISRAQGFIHGAKECLANQNTNVCAFMLHQAVEQCCIALISLHLDYRCDIHNLRRLLMLTRCFSDEPYQVFFDERVNDEYLFNLLTKSYLNGRYSKDFFISEGELGEMMRRVKRLMGIYV